MLPASDGRPLSSGIMARRRRLSCCIDRAREVSECHLGGILSRLPHVIPVVEEARLVVTAIHNTDARPSCATSCTWASVDRQEIEVGS